MSNLENTGADTAGTPSEPEASTAHPIGKATRSARANLVEAVSAALATPPAGASLAPTPNIPRILHQAMRGRYMVFGLLGLAVGAVCAICAWKGAHPLYKSEGLVRLKYMREEVLKSTDQNAPIQMFDTFMQSQRLLISSRRIIDMAIQDPIWKTTGRQVPADPEVYFSKNMIVDVMPRSEFISISVSDRDPATAAAAVTSVVNAYVELYDSEEQRVERRRLGALDVEQGNLKNKEEQLADEINHQSQDYGSANLDMFYDAAAFRVNQLQDSLAQIQSAIAAAPAPQKNRPVSAVRGAGRRSASANAAPTEASIEQIAVNDPVMLGYLNEQTRLEKQLDNLLLHGLGEAHHSVIDARRELGESRAQVIRYAQIYNEFHSAGQGGGMGLAGKSVAELQATEVNIQKLYKDARAQMVAVGEKRNALKQKSDDLQKAKEDLDQLTTREDSLRREESLGGRLEVVSSGEIPLSPDKDPRFKAASVAGAAGATLPTACLVLLSLLNQRYRYSKDTEEVVTPKKVPLLGIVPELAAGDGEAHVIAAAHSVHQIRVSLQAQESAEAAQAYLVTSATAGEGKTSLTTSLGLSFAASRLRTLVIDGDLIGRRLTRSLNLQEQEGLQEILKGAGMIERITRTETGMYVMSAGQGSRQHACGLSPVAVRSLLTAAREHFEVILIDTGPMLGSLEASVFAREVDGVLFAIARGQERQLTELAMHRLRSLGVRIVGCVFNRAKAGDFHGSSYYGTYARSLPADPNSQTTPPSAAAERFSGFGPLVKAVAADVPVSDN